MTWRRIFGMLMMLLGGVGMTKWVLDGLPIFYGTAYANGQNLGTVGLVALFIYGLYSAIKGGSKQK
jgi:hypothetical protein